MTEDRAANPPRRDLVKPAAVAAMLAFAGLPLYIHAPRYYADEMGVGLATLGAVLLGARALDSLQDPIIGHFADRFPLRREIWVLASGALLFTGFALLFAAPGWWEPLPRLAIGLVAAFTGFSALQIALYDHGLAQAAATGGDHTRIALWREAGGLAGICLAAAAPAVLEPSLGGTLAYSGYAVAFAAMASISLGGMRGRWLASGRSLPFAGIVQALRAPGVKPLLAFGFLNALPTAVTSTLVLFFLADILEAETHGGFVLLAFFAAAACAAPCWARLAAGIGCKAALASGVALSVPVFVWAYALGSGDIAAFYVIAVASGAALGADMTLAPAMLAGSITGGGGQVFALWTFLQKSALALAAGLVLPLLDFAGYEPGTQSETGLMSLSVAYALVPCILKLAALPVLLFVISEEAKP
ncbi:MAG: MFS transporter [Roseovarius sp.]|nr:MFS transporter [Roseovarius sp.]MCY4292970.1 MFS transporter [Roseovarius sp.]